MSSPLEPVLDTIFMVELGRSVIPTLMDKVKCWTRYVKNEDVAMSSPLGPVLDNIFMVKLERSVIPTLMDKVKCWTRYVDDTLCHIKTDSIDYVLNMLIGFYRNIQFRYEVETDSKISFLDVLVIRDSRNNISMTVYRKSTNNDIYLT